MNPLQGSSPSPLPSFGPGEDQTTSGSAGTVTQSGVPSAGSLPPQASSEPGTSLGARSASVVTTAEPGASPQLRDAKAQALDGRDPDGADFSGLPPPLLEIIAAYAADNLHDAKATLEAMASAQGHDGAAASKIAAYGAATHRMIRESLDLAGDWLLEGIPSGEIEPVTLQEAHAFLRVNALALGYRPHEIDAWLADPRTTGMLLNHNRRIVDSMGPEHWSAQLALYYVTNVEPNLHKLPRRFLTEQVCLGALMRPSCPSYEFISVPEAVRTPDFIDTVVRRHPRAMFRLQPEQRTLAVYEAAATCADFLTFINLPVSPEMAASAGYRALVSRLAMAADSKG